MPPPVDRLSVATYNVHACVGTDGRYDPDRVAAVIAELDADIVAVQEFAYPVTVALETRQPVVFTALDRYECALGPDPADGHALLRERAADPPSDRRRPSHRPVDGALRTARRAGGDGRRRRGAGPRAGRASGPAGARAAVPGAADSRVSRRGARYAAGRARRLQRLAARPIGGARARRAPGSAAAAARRFRRDGRWCRWIASGSTRPAPCGRSPRTPARSARRASDHLPVVADDRRRARRAAARPVADGDAPARQVLAGSARRDALPMSAPPPSAVDDPVVHPSRCA